MRCAAPRPRRITAVIPYFGYARQDRRHGRRTPISAKLVANLITEAGADRVLTLDLHAGQIQGFFDIPTDNLFAAPVMVRDIKERIRPAANVMIVSPDVGGVVRARALAKRIERSRHRRQAPRPPGRERGDEHHRRRVAGHACILIDDIVDSGGTLVNAAEALLAAGRHRSLRLHHPWRAVGRRGRNASPPRKLKELVITDSIQPTEAVKVARNIRVVSIAPLIGEAIARTASESSVSSLFD
jgi:ribose-phosphate pyrophosphokinase